MFRHEVRELESFEGFIDQLDQIGVRLVFLLLVIFVVDVKHPLTVVFKVSESLVDFPYPFFFEESLFKQEVFDGGL
jgi:hypothetical protein